MQLKIADRQSGAKQRRYIFHVRMTPCKDRRSRNEFRFQCRAKGQHIFELQLGIGVKSVVETTRRCVLSLMGAVREGRFREDLLCRINLWTFSFPGLRSRPEDIDPNLQFELDQHARKTGYRVTFSKEAREEFLQFSLSASALWSGNFRDLNAAVARMATLAQGARISVDLVREEIQRLRGFWFTDESSANDPLAGILSAEQLAHLDLFDRLQLERVLEVCRRSRSMSEAGRTLFHVSRSRKTTSNDADRLRKYLARFGLGWTQVTRA